MATAHGAGLMLWPPLMPICMAQASGAESLSGAAMAALVAVGLHSVAMIATTAAVAALVYEWLGLELLRRAWLNLDLLWITGLVTTGALLLLTSSGGGSPKMA